MRKLDSSVRSGYVQQAGDWQCDRGLHCYWRKYKTVGYCIMVCWDGLPYILLYTGCRKPPFPNFVRWWGDQNKDVLSRNYMLEMCLCSTIDCHFVSDEVWKSSKTTEVFWKKLYFIRIYSRCSNKCPLNWIHSFLITKCLELKPKVLWCPPRSS